jgi:hypothetical protein
MKRFLLKPWASNFDIYFVIAVCAVAEWVGSVSIWLAIAFLVPTILMGMFVSVLLTRTFLPDERTDRT